MVLKIIGGRAGGRRLQVPRGFKLRPTPARVREAIFDMIGPEIAGATVLDLFAGVGSLGIEALSRGAAAATFVEENARAVKLIRENLNLVPGADATVLQGGVLRMLNTVLKGRSFDILFMDPPYGKDLIPGTLTAIAASQAAGPGALIFAEHATKETIITNEKTLKYLQTKKYGDTSVSIFELQRENG